MFCKLPITKSHASKEKEGESPTIVGHWPKDEKLYSSISDFYTLVTGEGQGSRGLISSFDTSVQGEGEGSRDFTQTSQRFNAHSASLRPPCNEFGICPMKNFNPQGKLRLS